jgi:hypothetical protein
LLSGPDSSGARALPDGQQQSPGGWNRLVLAVTDLPTFVAALNGHVHCVPVSQNQRSFRDRCDLRCRRRRAVSREL